MTTPKPAIARVTVYHDAAPPGSPAAAFLAGAISSAWDAAAKVHDASAAVLQIASYAPPGS